MNSDILVWVRVRKYGYGKKSDGYGTGTGEFRKFYYGYMTGTKKNTKKVRKTVRVRKKVPARYGKR